MSREWLTILIRRMDAVGRNWRWRVLFGTNFHRIERMVIWQTKSET